MDVKSSSFLGAVQAVKNSNQPPKSNLPIIEKTNTKPKIDKKIDKKPEEKPVKKRVSSPLNRFIKLLSLNI